MKHKFEKLGEKPIQAPSRRKVRLPRGLHPATRALLESEDARRMESIMHEMSGGGPDVMSAMEKEMESPEYQIAAAREELEDARRAIESGKDAIVELSGLEMKLVTFHSIKPEQIEHGFTMEKFLELKRRSALNTAKKGLESAREKKEDPMRISFLVSDLRSAREAGIGLEEIEPGLTEDKLAVEFGPDFLENIRERPQKEGLFSRLFKKRR